MKKLVLLTLVAMAVANMAGCRNNERTQAESEKYIGERMEESVEDVQLFPTLNTSFVGDPMPYYEDGVFHVFYLEDLRDGKAGYHPWALYETSNFCEYESKGQVIPYGDSMEAQDIALGTGSIIKDKEGVYHAFYTGHNDSYTPKEAVMHATSMDMVTWTKIPEDTLYADEAYSSDDFRDPYVRYVEEEDQYWMLVSTRNESTGILAKYISADLKTWEDAGTFFVNDMGTDSNLECSTLLQYDGKWYLSFSDQWPDRLFHYRVSNDMNGPFKVPEQDVIDGNGFYAGRLETDGDHLYAFGWNGTKNNHMDSEDYNWAGNLVVHQLIQRENGDLFPIVNTQIKEKMKQELILEPIMMSETVTKRKNAYYFTGNQYEVVAFNDLVGSYLMEGTIRNLEDSEKFGFTFHTDEDGKGNLNLVFNVKENKIEFYNTKEIFLEDPQSEVPINFADAKELKVSILIDGGVVSMYVNDQCAITARMYASQGGNWGIFGLNSDVQIEGVKIYK